MKRICLLGFLLVSFISVFAQYKVEYVYDYAGNRISRTVITLSSNSRKNSTDIKPLTQKLGECEVKIYPNPTNGLLNMNITAEMTDVLYMVSAYSLEGKFLFNLRHVGNGDILIDFSNHANGTYLLLLKYRDKEIPYKIIKQ